MKRPNGISLFIQSNHQAIAELSIIYGMKWGCPHDCKVVKDCNGDCRIKIN